MTSCTNIWKTAGKSASAFCLAVALCAGSAQAQTAKTLFGAKKLPAVLQPAAHGFYSKGCLAGGVQIAKDGPRWQAMRLSRNRRWGHPNLVNLVARLSEDAAKQGWNGLLVGDLAQARGGPMLSGHASHQIGLDADIWLNPMPNRRYTDKERENVSAKSMLKNRYYVDDRRWTSAHTAVIRTAAKYPQVERLFVHPGIKKKLCDTVTGDRSWLQKVRPYWGHHYHFHIRMGCPPGSPGCKPQAKTESGTGCGSQLKWWFDVGLRPPKKRKPGDPKPKPVKKKPPIRLGDLPNACRTVLAAAAPADIKTVTLGVEGYNPSAAFAAPAAATPSAAAADALAGAPVIMPTPRPER